MAYTALQLIANAWYLSGIVSREFQTVTGAQELEGLDLFNALLAVKSADKRLIPYFTDQYALTLVIGQEKYSIPNLIGIEAITFNIGPVRYAMQALPRRQYWGAPRVDNITALPFSYFFERALNGGNLYVYFLPSQAYPVQISGKFSLGSVTLLTDLSLTMDKFYIEYYRYALAEYMCSDYNQTFNPQGAQKLRELEQIIIDISPYDLTLDVQSTLNQGGGLNWGDINIGKGYRPS